MKKDLLRLWYLMLVLFCFVFLLAGGGSFYLFLFAFCCFENFFFRDPLFFAFWGGEFIWYLIYCSNVENPLTEFFISEMLRFTDFFQLLQYFLFNLYILSLKWDSLVMEPKLKHDIPLDFIRQLIHVPWM